MPSMIDMLLNSGNNSPLRELSSRFGLSEDQARQAVEALAPALSIGMKRNVSSPMGAGSFIEALSSDRNEQFADNPVIAVSDEGINEGNKILGHLLGSKDVSRAVTEQAAQATGIGQSALKQMLPMLASMAMGSISKQAKMGIADGGSGAGGGILGKIMEGMLAGRTGGAGDAGGGLGPLGDLLGGFLGGGTGNTQRRTSDGDNPLGRIFKDALSGRGSGGSQPDTPSRRRTTDEGGLGQVFEDAIGQGDRSAGNMPVEEIRNNDTSDDGSLGSMLDDLLGDDEDNYEIEEEGQRRRPRSGGKLTDIFGDMLESGRKADDPYQGGLESIFDNFLKK